MPAYRSIVALAAASVAAFIPAARCRADARLANVFSDNLVLQRDKPVAVWGTAAPDAKLTVTIGDAHADASADQDGRWKAVLRALPADPTPRELVVTGDGPDAVAHNVVIGDVWFCSGQSNLVFTLDNATGGREAIAASDDPLLREFRVEVDAKPTPQADVTAAWRVASPKTSGAFSAVAYFFAAKLRKNMNVPIGIVNVSRGGTPIEAWSRRGSLDGVGFMKPVLKKLDAMTRAASGTPNAKPATQPAPKPMSDYERNCTPGWLYHTAIAPLVGLSVRGFVWYQGENNVDRAEEYRTLFPRMIRDWRQQWGDADLPFLFVQLTSHDPDDDAPYGEPVSDLRRAQAEALQEKNTAMAVSIDTHANDWHVPDKRPVGERLAALALKIAYHRDDVKTSGPLWTGRTFRDDGTAVIRFVSEGGLHAPDDRPTGFAIAGDDRRFVRADATIVGDTVELRAAGVTKPVAVRYGWSRGPAVQSDERRGMAGRAVPHGQLADADDEAGANKRRVTRTVVIARRFAPEGRRSVATGGAQRNPWDMVRRNASPRRGEGERCRALIRNSCCTSSSARSTVDRGSRQTSQAHFMHTLAASSAPKEASP